MEIKPKIELKTKGEKAALSADSLTATLSWKRAVDLDLYAIYETKDGGTGKCYFGKKRAGSISLSGDAGVGDVGGDNVEVMSVGCIKDYKHVIIVANIFGKSSANFASYDGHVSVVCGNEEFDVPLTANNGGSWCTVAHLDNSGVMPNLVNVNTQHRREPSVRDILGGAGTTADAAPEKKGLFGRLFG